ncbi:MAG: type II CAAX endopeptidase family protein [Chloroflexota bacterium]|nr:type II CAAX endopeptidase family protein [Chloroflexota bacterium]MED5450917.1 type II CAAX endopeptidase family protein [Chloroflexota bacterium]
MAKELESDLFVCGRPVSLFKFNLFSVAILFVTFSVIIFLRVTLGSDVKYSPVPWYYPWILAVPQLLLLGLVLSFSGVGYKGIKSFFTIPDTPGWVFASILTVIFSIGAILSYSVVVYKLEITYLMPPQIDKGILGDGSLVLANLFAIVIWVPFVEELFFRGLLLSVWVPYYGETKSILWVSLIFMLVHSHPGLYVPVFISSLLISVLFIKTGTIWAPFLSHAVQNLLVAVVAASA